jgi:hypothetical protein
LQGLSANRLAEIFKAFVDLTRVKGNLERSEAKGKKKQRIIG